MALVAHHATTTTQKKEGMGHPLSLSHEILCSMHIAATMHAN